MNINKVAVKYDEADSLMYCKLQQTIVFLRW